MGQIRNSDIQTQAGLTAGSYTNANVTFNAQGLATAASNGSGGGGGSLPTDYISGLQLQYSSTTVIKVNTGSAYVPAASAIVTVSSAVTNTPSLSASTMYYVFLNASGALVVSSTAPATNYQGTAWEDSSGDRYLGAFLTNSSSQIYNFVRNNNTVKYLTNSSVAPFMVVNAVTAISTTSVSCSGVVPPTSRVMQCTARVGSVGSGNNSDVYFATSDITMSASNYFTAISVVDSASNITNYWQYAELVLNSSQAFTYLTTSNTPLTAYVTGYEDTR